MTQFAQEICDFLNDSPTIPSCIQNIRSILLNSGYTELEELSPDSTGKFFITTETSVIAGYRHEKSPCSLVFHSDFGQLENIRRKEGTDPILRSNLEIAGKPGVKSEWFDRPLNVAGVVGVCEGDKLIRKVFNIREPCAFVPSLFASLSLCNPVAEGSLVFGLDKGGSLGMEIQKKAAECIGCRLEDLKWNWEDVEFYDGEDVKLSGISKDLICGSRLSNFLLGYLATRAFIDSPNRDRGYKLLCLGAADELKKAMEVMDCPIRGSSKLQWYEFLMADRENGEQCKLGSGVKSALSQGMRRIAFWESANDYSKSHECVMTGIPIIGYRSTREIVAIVDCELFYQYLCKF